MPDFMSMSFANPVLPELVLALTALVLVMVGALRGENSTSLVYAGTFVALALALVLVLIQPQGRFLAFNNAFVVDAFGRFMKVLTLIGSGAVLLMSQESLRRDGMGRFEFPLLVLLATLGMMIMISANDLITLYLGLELQSLAAYVIAAFNRDNVKSSEAGLKYFVLGALSSGMLLYGASLLYGFTGTVTFPGLALALKGDIGLGAILGLVFLTAGLAFKLSAVPFHMWTPDVYEGAPTPVTTFFASAPKMAAMALLLRVFMGAFPNIAGQWQQIVIFIALASMLLGSFAAIGQPNIKRLMAYSSIGNIGYALIGLAAGGFVGIQGVLIYMAIYLATTLGAFACILSLRRDGKTLEQVSDLAGAARSHPVMAFCLAMMMFSLAGIPPLAGFFAKFYVFSAAIQAGLNTLAVIGVVTSVVGAYYYLRVVKVMYFDESQEAFDPMPSGVKFVLGVSAVVVILFWIMPAPLATAAMAAAKSLF